MRRINRGIDSTEAGTARQLCIAGLFSLLFLLATSTYALAVDCTICHYPGGIGPLPHDAGCQDTSCAQACHTSQDVNMHPTSMYTPWGNGTADRATICRTCHDKPWPNVYHPYTINVSAGSITPPGSVDLDQACGQCHGGGTDNVTSPPKKTPDGLYDYPYYNKTTLGAFATSIHVYKPMPTASFTAAYDPVVSYKVNFDASASTCPAEVAPCAYAWDFTNDGTNDIANAITTTYTYGGASSQTVKLTVTDNIFRTATTTRSVSPRFANAPPVASFTVNTSALPAVTVTNTSTDENVATVKFYLTWGDGTSEPIRTGLSNPTFTHTYAAVGTFSITLLATDSAGAANSTSTPVTVTTAKFTIGGTVTAGPAGSSNVNSVLLTLKKGTTVVANTYTGATGAGPFSYSFPNLAAGNYTVTAYKSGAVFAETNPTAAITVGPDSPSNNFTTVKTKFRITSTAKGSGGANLSGVTIIVKNSAGTTVAQGTTNTSGVYATNMTLAAGTYTVTASKAGRAFSNTPQTITFANGNADGTLTFTSTTP